MCCVSGCGCTGTSASSAYCGSTCMIRVTLRQSALWARLELAPELSGLTALASMELMPCSESGWRWASAPLALPALTKLQVALPTQSAIPCGVHICYMYAMRVR